MTEPQPLRVLHVEDNEDDARLVLRALEQAGYTMAYLRVLTAPEMQAALQNAVWHVVISDYNLPQFSAPQALATLHATGLDLPFIIVSGAIVEEQAVSALRSGAHDFITKGNLARLAPAIERELREAAERHQRRAAQAALQALEQRFRALIENSADAITLLGSAGQVIYDSPAAPRLLGYGPDEFIGRSAFDIVHPDDQATMQAQLRQLLQDPANPLRLQLRLQHANGTWRWIEGVATNLLAEPSVQAIVVNYRDNTERRQAEDRIRFQAHLLDTVGQAVIATDLDGTITYWNRFAATLYGWSAAAALGRNLLEVTPTHSAHAYAAELMAALRAGQSWSGEFTVQRRDGTVFPVQVTNTPIFDDTGALVGLIGVSVDITERKRSETALRRERDLIARVMETSPVGIVRVNRTGQIVFANPRAEQVLGLSKASQTELTYNPPAWRITDYDGAPLPDAALPFARTRATGQPVYGFQHAIVWPSGRRVLLSSNAAPMFAETGHFDGMVATLEDVTELREAERALQASEQRFRALIEHSNDGMTLSNREGRLLYRAPANHRLTGYENNERLGGSLFDLVHPDDVPHMQARLAEALAHPRRAVELEYRLRHQDGTWHWLHTTFNNLLDEPSINAVVANYRDITERRQTEDKVRRQFVYLTALREIDRAIMASIDLRLSLSLLLAHLTTQQNVVAATVMVYNPSTRRLELAAERGFRAKPFEWAKLRLGEGYAGRAALERRSVHFDDLRTQADNPSLAQTIAANGFVGYDAVPLIAKGEVRGVLEVFRQALPPEAATGEAEAEWQDFLQALSAQAAIAVDNATLFERLQRSNLELAQAYDENIEGWSRALDLRDKEAEGRSRRVTDLTLRLAEAVQINAEELVHVRRGALLHDIGQMGIPDHILLKPGPLTEAEWHTLRTHPTIAYELLSPIEFLRPALDIPYCHHEQWDGTGYPRGLKGEEIPLAARVFAVVDVWDALCSDRPYRPAWPSERARAHIEARAGSHFDPRVVAAFLQLVE